MKVNLKKIRTIPFSSNQIELYLAGECDNNTRSGIEEYMVNNDVFRKYIDTCRGATFKIPLSEVVKLSKTESTREVSANLTAFLNWIKEWFNVFRLSPQVKVAFSLLVLLVIGITITMGTGPKNKELQAYAKGTSKVELFLNDTPVNEEQEYIVEVKDTLRFQYRSVNNIHIMVLYQDDGKNVEPYIGSPEGALVWKPSLDWKRGGKKIILGSDFLKEHLWIIYSTKIFSKSEACEIVTHVKKHEYLVVQHYIFSLSQK